MKQTITAIIILALVPALVLIGLVVADGRAERQRTAATSRAGWQLGDASFRFDKATAVTASTNLAPALQEAPLPTNRWWQSAATGDFPETLFNLPFASRMTADGFATGVPPVAASADVITSAPVADVTFAPVGYAISGTRVTSFDDVAVTLEAETKDGRPAYAVRLVKGTPFVYLAIDRPMQLKGASVPRRLSDGRSAYDMTVAGRQYAVYVPAGTPATAAGANLNLAPKGTTDVVVAAIPAGLTEADRARYDAAAASAVTGGTLDYAVEGQVAVTRINWTVEGGGDTLYGLLPHQLEGNAGAARIGSFATIRGAMAVVAGKKLEYRSPVPASEATIPMPKDDAFFTRAKLQQYLAQERDAYADPKPLSYDGGKELFRLANVYLAAKAAGSDTAGFFKGRLSDELTDWLRYTPGETDRYFYYDAKVRGLVAMGPQYSSELFNDHHFHYGYFLYAASVLGTDDAAFVKSYGAGIDALADDIAGSDRESARFPFLRVFDVTEGHSWADGTGRFADGNNQESVSEAVSAWFAMKRWGEVRGDTDMVRTATWLYANEVAAARTYWFASAANLFPAGYKHQQVSLVWGGKADWATWFSAEPAAKHGILMLPLSGGSLYLGENGLAKRDLEALSGELGGKSAGSWQDTITMVRALYDPAAARTAFDPAATFDNSNSRAYMYLWLGWAGQRQGSGS